MESVFSGCILDPEKCSRLSLGEKRELVHEIAQWPKDAPEMLQSFTRPELLEIICAEMGKERKYTGYTKSQMIGHLLKLVSQDSKRSDTDNSLASSPAHIGHKRKRNIGPRLDN
ncbi:vin3-like protein 2 [Quercus suber]|uniref:Vin3-like protein 2 n=1 Tax=Quercus suber TaxID=58331 RepID=A0AAW0JFK0_QUESU